ncbi:45 kDa calcium-binding protein [Myotis brandtii]|uniref:45 kDa calcium-binding protein n=1 Tax=Myotis brandtii TaxID=109478 RepID=S7N1B8_MYOBR|nr:45 kDa calcium-binding protein [Myotis brandtii]
MKRLFVPLAGFWEPVYVFVTSEEFLSFLHPEHSRGMLRFMVKEIVRDLDQDGDKQLSLSEFISLPVGTVENQRGQDMDDSWVRDRRKEFEELIDANHDGIVTMAELENIPAPVLQPSPQGVGEKAELTVAVSLAAPGAWGADWAAAGADAASLQEYMDPMNEYNALNEAKQMIAIADENQNQHLEPEEVLKYSEFFTGSKLVDYARSVHEEF